MATATIAYTADQLHGILKMSTKHTVPFTAVEIPAGALTTLAQAYLDLLLTKNDSFEPLGGQLRRFANAQVPVIKAAILAAG